MDQCSDVKRSFVKHAMSAPFLTRDNEHELAKDWRYNGNVQALHQLAAAHMRLVISIAARFRHYGLSMSDLVQEGHIGLLEAGARFEPERDVRFSTYATWWIRASIQDFILRNWSIVRGGTSSTQKALFFNLRKLRARLTQEAGSDKTIDIHAKIAEAIGVSRNDVAIMDMRLGSHDQSIDAPISDHDEGEGTTRGDLMVDTSPLPDELVSSEIDTARRSHWLQSALSALSERERTILKFRKLSDEGFTLEQLGYHMGISKERVRQIETRAMEKLKRALLEREPSGPSAFV
jgi:RNA polymerase sigma-32 factor